MFASFHRHDGVNGYSILRRDGHLAVAGDACIVKVKEEGNAGVTRTSLKAAVEGATTHVVQQTWAARLSLARHTKAEIYFSRRRRSSRDVTEVLLF